MAKKKRPEFKGIIIEKESIGKWNVRLFMTEFSENYDWPYGHTVGHTVEYYYSFVVKGKQTLKNVLNTYLKK